METSEAESSDTMEVTSKLSTDDQQPTAKTYWSNIPPTVDGMLGGFGYISPIDINGSARMLKLLCKSTEPPDRMHALDCGAGIGRISKYLLSEVFERVDLLEQNSEFLEAAKSYMGPRLWNKVDKCFSENLQDFSPVVGKYDVIWVQWVLGYLTDDEIIAFLQRCRSGLKRNGVIIVKENVTSSGEVEFDEEDASVTRSYSQFMELFQRANLHCFKQLKQHNFPKGLYSVIMFAIR